jgi:hypothetical protein
MRKIVDRVNAADEGGALETKVARHISVDFPDDVPGFLR